MTGDTIQLLRRWRDGDRGALEALIRRNLDWVSRYVHQRLGDALRQRAETQDLVQDAIIDVLRFGPRFEISDERRFRALLARIVENNIRDQNKWMRRNRRDVDRENNDSVLHLDPVASTVTSPSGAADRAEAGEWIRLGLELLSPEDREVIWLREWEQLSFEEVGERIDAPANTARMRFGRALPRLAARVAELRQGRLDLVLPG